jgi:heme iron utilization protein
VHRRGPAAAVALQMHAEQAELAEVFGQLAGRNVANFEPLGNMRNDILGAELSDRVAHRDLIARQRHVQAERILRVEASHPAIVSPPLPPPTCGGSVASVTVRDHGDAGDGRSTPPPLQPPVGSARPSAAEQARTIAAAGNAGTLATLTADGDPWASFVAYGLLGGKPVLCLSNLAEHGRNLAGDPRASLSIVAASSDSDPLASSRITLAGLVSQPSATDRDAVRAAYVDAVPAARVFLDFSDFTLWVLEVQRVRWVGGYGRMDSATGEYPDTETAVCTAIDRYGLDTRVTTPRGIAYARVGFQQRLDSPDQLRSATVELAHLAGTGRTAL